MIASLLAALLFLFGILAGFTMMGLQRVRGGAYLASENR